ncbi:MAG TPA: nucleoside triphosphate pyrophosphohydrolase [Anaerolineales bacterium]|nr:nucleoside triphosphate pyrophosphohydrolase [Anaerolineales bacterium]
MDFSRIAAAFEILRLSPPSQLVLLEAATFSSAHVPPFPPDTPAFVTGLDSRELGVQVRDVLLAVYPMAHRVSLVDLVNRTTETQSLVDLAADQGQVHFSSATCLYLAAMPEGTSFESFQEIVAHLRAPNGCPWDREQTHESLRKHLLEESYEAIAALDSGDFNSMREELGDLLLQIMLHSQIANEKDEFTANEVVKGIYDKIVRRHPHVFGDVKVGGVDGVLQNWEKLKEQERRSNGEMEKGMLDGVPRTLPALSQAQEYQDRAARVGFDWPVIDEVLDKLIEEAREVERAETDFELADEIGDLFFVLVNFARWKKVDAESALRGTNKKFKKRFAYIEANAKKQGRNLSDMTLEEMDALWNEAKNRGDS